MFATFLCTFLLLLFFGTFSYVYVLWKHYVLRVQKLYREAEVSAGAAERVGLHGGRHPYRIPNPIVDSESKDEETTEAIPDDKLEERVSHFETQIIAQLRNAAVETGKRVLAGDVKNAYGARHDSPGMGAAPMRPKEDPATLVCQVANKVQIATFVRGAEAFFVEEQLDRLLPERPLLEKNATFDTCGVVSSSGALLKSGLGAKIDSNDFVIRFNNAPSGRDKDDYSGGGDYERDVGSKTSLRIVNSQVVGKPQFKFLESQSLYADSPVLVWDPSKYGSSVSEWYSHPDYAFFETFFSRRLMRIAASPAAVLPVVSVGLVAVSQQVPSLAQPSVLGIPRPRHRHQSLPRCARVRVRALDATDEAVPLLRRRGEPRLLHRRLAPSRRRETRGHRHERRGQETGVLRRVPDHTRRPGAGL